MFSIPPDSFLNDEGESIVMHMHMHMHMHMLVPQLLYERGVSHSGPNGRLSCGRRRHIIVPNTTGVFDEEAFRQHLYQLFGFDPDSVVLNVSSSHLKSQRSPPVRP